jgi:glucose/arabinose dehydrogenase
MHSWLSLKALCIAVSIFLPAPAGALEYGSEYEAQGRCGPFPRVQVTTPPGFCLGIVAGPSHGLIWPRSIIQVAENRFIVTDMMGWWERKRGRVLLLTIKPDGAADVSPVYTDRNLPHGLALGPDGRVYVGDDDSVWRFDPGEPGKGPETLVAGLPGKPSRGGNHWHPLKQLAFDRDGNLLVNMGAPDDDCQTVPGAKEQWPYPCPYGEGPEPDAALWKLELHWPGGKPGTFAPFARGLRNTVALAVHPKSGLIFQGENASDKWDGKSDENLPPDELNIIRQGRHYGWPYCAGFGAAVIEYRGRVKDCSAYEAPYMLLPAHAAPLGMLFYTGRMFPELQGRLLIAFHGFRDSGHRLVAYKTDGEGKPLLLNGSRNSPLAPLVLAGNWTRLPGVRPMGRPLAITQANDGAVWFVDDKARTIMVLRRSEQGGPAYTDRHSPKDATLFPGAPAQWRPLYQSVLQRHCEACHEEFRERNPDAAWAKLVASGFIEPADPKKSLIFQRMRGEGAGNPMPMPEGLKGFPQDYARLEEFIAALQGAKP